LFCEKYFTFGKTKTIMTRVIPSFHIEIDRVLLRKELSGKAAPIEKEFIRGDLVYSIRKWHKSERDNELVQGEMCEVTVRDPANPNIYAPFQKYQVAEAAEVFKDRLKALERESRDPKRHAAAEPGS
jgi:hypothetical protein